MYIYGIPYDRIFSPHEQDSGIRTPGEDRIGGQLKLNSFLKDMVGYESEPWYFQA